MYLGDYDDAFVPVNHIPGGPMNPLTDETWVQMLRPYTGSFSVFFCPADTSNPALPDATFDQDLVLGDLTAEYYAASMRSNVGYNFQYLAPITKIQGVWQVQTVKGSDLPEPDSMLMYADSAWQVTNGVPTGGGSWLVSPPCRYQEINGQRLDTITQKFVSPRTPGSPTSGDGQELFVPTEGWDPDASSPQIYGGLWTWHTGRTNVVTVGGEARSETIGQVTQGCDVLPKWTGNIYDRSLYVWSPR